MEEGKAVARLLPLLLVGLCAAVLAIQLLAPPMIGLANNGDSAKVTGWLSLGPAGQWVRFDYVQSDYVHAPQYFWNS